MGGKKSIKMKSYTTACDWLLATAPLLHLLDTWSNKDHYALGRADLELVVSAGAVNLSGHIPKTAIAVETHTIPSSGPYTVAVSHAANWVTGLGNPPVQYKGGSALQYSGPNPPGLGEYQVSAGVYTFNAGDAGHQVVISYAYSTGSVDDANFFAVLGVAAETSVDETFADFGDPATTRTTAGVQRRWLWNSFWDPPEVFEAAYGITSRAPWAYSVSGLVISVDSSLNGAKLVVRVAFRIPTSSWDGNPLSALPFGMQFEPQLGSGSEYVNHLDEQVIYPDCSGVAADRLDLGTSATYPQMSFEATGYYSLTADGDCNPADLLLAIALLGVYANPGYTGNTTITTLQMLALSLVGLGLDDGIPIMAPPDDLRAFCEAYGIYVTAPMEQQRSAADWFKEICEIAGVAIVASGFQVKLIPYCERSEVGNGVVYTAPTAAGPIYDLIDKDFLDKKQPVVIARKRSVDQYNLQPVTYIERDDDYADATATGADQGGVYARMSQRAQPKDYKTIFTKDVADKVSTVLAKKQSIDANEYSFKISSTRYVLLEAMGLVRLTDARTGLNKLPVRITEANETEKHVMECKAEEFLYGLNAPQLVVSAAQQGTRVETNHDPGSVNPPPIFVDVPQLDPGQTGAFLTIGLSGASPDWGGALVWASLDGTTYTVVASQVGRSVMGITVGDFPAHADPDTADDLAVDLTESLETLDSFSTAYEDAFISLCYIEGGNACIPYEVIAYGLAQLTGANQYTLKATGSGNKIRRGVYSTPIGDHPGGSKFLFMGGPRVRLPIDPKYLGKTVHFKFTSFNSFGKELESLADVTDYPYTIPVPCTGTILGGRPDAVIDIPATSAAGNFSVAHGMAAAPRLALIQMTSGGKIWFQAARYDATNLYLVSSDAGVTAKVLVYSVSPAAEVALAPGAPGNFDVAHGLASVPAIVIVQMTCGGEIWAQSPVADATNLHLIAADGGLTGFAELWATSLSPTATQHATIRVAPVFPGNFAVPHGLGVVPSAAFIRMNDGAEIWFQPPRYDATNLYLVASDGGITASIEVFA